MYVALVDAEVLSSREMHIVKNEYIKRFGKESFPQFNYADFQRQGEKCSAQIYKEALEKCIAEGKPYDVPTKWHPEKRWKEYFQSIGELPEEDKE